jgi:hypothetical protein
MEEKVDVSNALSSNYMLASLYVPMWSGRKTDKAASAELNASKGAVANASSVVKNLFAGKDAALKDTHAAYTRIRTWFYENTVPWTTNNVGAMKGDRLIATVQSFDFLNDFAKLKKDAEAVKAEFLNEYDQLVQDVAQNLGNLYDATQYPSKATISKLFGAELKLQPLPEVTDFNRLTNVPASLVTGLSDLYQRNMEAQMNNALGDVQKRLLSELERMDTQLSKVAKGEKTRLFKSMATNLKHLVGLARSVNFTDNPNITKIADDIEEHLLAYEVDAYKDNASLAGQVARQARAIAAGAASDEVWRITNDLTPQEEQSISEDDTQVVEDTSPEFTDGGDDDNPIISDDQNFLASLVSGDDDDVVEDEIADDKEEDEKNKVEEPEFDESEFLFNN